jgi:hypothetical protein
MSLSVSKGMVADAAKQLIEAWKRARRDWDDDMAQWFEDEFLEPLSPKIRGTMAAMDKLASMSTQGRAGLLLGADPRSGPRDRAGGRGRLSAHARRQT